MHIERPDQVTMSLETTQFAVPLPIPRLVLMPTTRTLATCSPFGASEARDVSLFTFMGQVVDVLAIFPQSHPLVMMMPIVTVAYPVWIAHEERSYLLLNTESYHLTCGFVAQVTNTAFSTSA